MSLTTPPAPPSTPRVLGLPLWRPGPNPLLATTVASLIAISIVGISMLWTRQWTGFFLVWNLILAWIPVGFAVLAERPGVTRTGRWTWAILWLLFYPNAPYIFTDLTHLDGGRDPRFWTELCMVLLFAMTGLIAGFLSLHRMQRLVTRHYGWVAGWGMVLAMSVLGSAGVAVGRFLRRNSWDVMTRPWHLVVDIGGWLYRLPQERDTSVFLGLFTLFLFLSYVMIHNMAALGDPLDNSPARSRL